MTRTVYVLENRSKHPGSFFLAGVQHALYPGELVTVKKEPTSVTANLTKSYYLEECTGNKTTKVVGKEDEGGKK